MKVSRLNKTEKHITMTLNQFIDIFYRKVANTFYSRYSVEVIGFALSDASWYTIDEIEESFNLFNNDRKTWLDEYAWSEDAWEKADNIDWLKSYII